MLWSLLMFAGSLFIVVAAAWWLHRKSTPALPDELVRPPPPEGFQNLTGAEYELIEWELRVERQSPPSEPRGVAPPPD